MKRQLCGLTMVFIFLLTGAASAVTRLTVNDVRALAVEHNRRYLAAQQDVVKADGDIKKARSGAFPDITLSGRYNRNLYIPSFFLTAEGEDGSSETIEFQTGFNNNFGATLSLRQPLWNGRVFPAMTIAGTFKKYSEEVANQVKADVELQAELLYYNALLQSEHLVVLNKSLQALNLGLEVVEKQHGQGLLSEFELLRARVERDNLLPTILQSESEVRLAEKRLKSFLGIDLGEEVVLEEDSVLTITESQLSLPLLTDSALILRPEIKQAEYMTAMRRKAVSVARSGYLPSIEAVSQYDWSAQSDEFTMRDNNSRSLTVGLAVTIPIFRGGAVRGSVSQAVADHQQSKLAESQWRDDIRLEVEAAHDRLIQARKTLEIQQGTIAQADEGFRIATLRYESGVGTQLEVLSAEAALTDARRARVVAFYKLREARARLKRATMIDIAGVR